MPIEKDQTCYQCETLTQELLVNKKVRCLLIDDNLEFLHAAGVFLSILPDVEVIGLALSRSEAIRQAIAQAPDVVILDMTMLRLEGFFTIPGLKSLIHPPLVIVTSAADDMEYESLAMEAGADGFVGKTGFAAEIRGLISNFQQQREHFHPHQKEKYHEMVQ